MRRQLLTGLLTTICLLVVLSVVYPLAVWAVGRVAFRHQTDGSFVTANGRVLGSTLIGQSFLDKAGNPLPRYFQPRPSAAGSGYDATANGGSNLGPSNPLLIGFVPGVSTPPGPDGRPAKVNRFATPADPFCVPTDLKGNPVTAPNAGQVYARASDGTYVCDPNTVPQRSIAYRQLNGLPPNAPVPVDAVTASGSGLDPGISVANALDQAARVASARHLSRAAVVALIDRHISARAWGILGERTVNVLDLNLALDRLGSSG
jgi:K+-transporting ATPase ATPase C chain